MQKAVFKYAIRVTDTQTVTMPTGAKPISAQCQRGVLCVWAEVNPDPGVRQVRRLFRVFDTGHTMPENPGQFIDTVQMHDGNLIFHVYVDPE